MLIDDAEHAAKLARALLSDITLYNDERIKHAKDPERDLAAELGEGRKLFWERVTERHYSIYEEAVAKWAVDVRARATSFTAATVAAARRDEEDRRRADDAAILEAEEARSRRNIVMLVVALLLAVAGTGVLVAMYERAHEHDAHDTHDKHEGH